MSVYPSQVESSLHTLSEVHGPLHPPHSDHSGPERGVCGGLGPGRAPGPDCHSGGPSHRSQRPHIHHSSWSVPVLANPPPLFTSCVS